MKKIGKELPKSNETNTTNENTTTVQETLRELES